MITRQVIIIFVFLAFSFFNANADYCTFDLEDQSTWEKCQNQAVKITGNISELPSQHPTGLHNTFDDSTQALIVKFENYLDINGHEIVLTSDKEINCTGRIEVEGIVDIIDLNGEKGTTQNYKNIWIKVNSFQCK